MKIEKYIKLLQLFEKDILSKMGTKGIFEFHLLDEGFIRLKELLITGKDVLKEHAVYFSNVLDYYNFKKKDRYIGKGELEKTIKYISSLTDLYKTYDVIQERKFLQNANDKLSEAGISFENEDYTSVINNLNTAIELALKDNLDIPLTIKKINTRKILDICISEKVGPTEYLKELIKHVLDVDNKVKHNGYIPSKKDCIDAIDAVEGFLKKTNKYPFTVTEKVKQKIFSGI